MFEGVIFFDKMWIKNLVDLLRKSWQGRLLLATISVVAVCASIFEPFSFPRPVAQWHTVVLGIHGGLIVKGLANLGLLVFFLIVLLSIARLALEKLAIGFLWLTGDRDKHKSVGTFEDVIGFAGFMLLAGCGFGLLVEAFGFNKNVGFTLWWALWGLIVSFGIATFFVVAAEEQGPRKQPPERQEEANRIVLPGDRDFRVPR